MMQSAENLVMGQTQKGGPAAVMQSASTKNERAGFVSRDDVSDVPADEGVTVTETDLPGRRVVTETVAGQVVGQYEMPAPLAPRSISHIVTAQGVLICHRVRYQLQHLEQP
ncbi:uncharacterized protein A4U43_C08F19050 [Asparagus officinalis]|nr:uncharacterized protein A4U43_C08F19050 [Asparagus officinalis]